MNDQTLARFEFICNYPSTLSKPNTKQPIEYEREKCAHSKQKITKKKARMVMIKAGQQLTMYKNSLQVGRHKGIWVYRGSCERSHVQREPNRQVWS